MANTFSVSSAVASINMAAYTAAEQRASQGASEAVNPVEKSADTGAYDSKRSALQKKAYEIAREVSRNSTNVDIKINQMKNRITRVANQTRRYENQAIRNQNKSSSSEWDEAAKRIAKLTDKNAMLPEDIKGGMVNSYL